MCKSWFDMGPLASDMMRCVIVFADMNELLHCMRVFADRGHVKRRDLPPALWVLIYPSFDNISTIDMWACRPGHFTACKAPG